MALTRSISASVRLAHGSATSQSRYVRATVYSAAAGDILERRSSSRRASFLTSSDMPGLLDLLPELVELPLLVVSLAQLLLDGLHLLAEVVLALVLLELGLDLALDLVADLEDLEVLGQDLVDALEADLHVQDLEELLLLGRAQGLEAPGDEVGQARRVLDVRGQGLELVGERGGELHHALEEPLGALGQGLDLDLLLEGHDLPQDLDARLQERPVLGDLKDPEPMDALDDEAERSVGELEHLVDVGERPDAEEVALDGIVDGRIPLGDDADDLVVADGVVDERHGALPRHGQRKDGVGEEDRVAQRQDRELRGDLGEVDLVGARGSLEVGRTIVAAVAHENAFASCASNTRVSRVRALSCSTSSWHARHSAAKGRAVRRASAISVLHSPQTP